MSKRYKTIDLPFEEGQTYTTRFATGEKFLLKKIVYRKKSKSEDPDVPIQFEGIYERCPDLGICPLALDRLIPRKETIEEEIPGLERCSQEQYDKLLLLGFPKMENIPERSLAIRWIRETKHFEVLVEHGARVKEGGRHVGTYDLTTSFGCHRGSYRKYEDAESIGLDIVLNHLSGVNNLL